MAMKPKSINPSATSPVADTENELLRVSQIIRLIPISATTWQNWVNRGIAPKPSLKTGGSTLWRRADIRAFIDAQQA
jgi:predicted DNA-binding transcriptional regulator AlpA